MIKIGAPPAIATEKIARTPRKLDDDENLSINGTYAFNVQRIVVVNDPDEMCYLWFDFIEGADLKWRGEFCTGQNYGNYRQRVKKVTKAHEGFDSLADLFASLKDKSFKLWDGLKAAGSTDKYISVVLNALQDFDYESQADAILYPDASDTTAAEAEPNTDNDSPAVEATVQPYRESDICPDPDEVVTHIPPLPREPVTAVVSTKTTRNAHGVFLQKETVAVTTLAEGTQVVMTAIDHEEETPATIEPMQILPAVPECEQATIAVDPDYVTTNDNGQTSNTLDQDAIDLWRAELANAEKLVCNLSVEGELLKEKLSTVKKRLDEAVTDLVRIRNESPEVCPDLYHVNPKSNDATGPTTDIAELATGENSTDNATAEPAKTFATAATSGDDWRKVELSKLDLPAGILSILAEADFTTIGQIADHTASGKRLTDIAKVGQAKAEKIEQAMEDFWRKNPQ
jgi:hypothetical protein